MDTHGPLCPQAALTREDSPLVSPLALLLTTLDGVSSSSAGDFVRGGTTPTVGRQNSQWASGEREGREMGACFSEEAQSHLRQRGKAQDGWALALFCCE